MNEGDLGDIILDAPCAGRVSYSQHLVRTHSLTMAQALDSVSALDDWLKSLQSAADSGKPEAFAEHFVPIGWMRGDSDH